MPRIPQLAAALLLVSVVTLSTGCAMLGWNDGDKPRVHVVESPTRPVINIIALWQPAEGHDLEGLPCRGFAAQIMFFCIGNEVPAEVGGDVSIYVFDDHGTIEEQQRPIHIFEFPAEAWNTYRREATVGTTYQLFIPYTRRTSEAAKCNLRMRYTSAEGRVTFSKETEIALPGTPRTRPMESSIASQVTQAAATQPTAAATEAPVSGISQAAHQAPADCGPECVPEAAAPASMPGMFTSQISLPPAQLANHQMAALDQLVQSLDRRPVSQVQPAGGTPSPTTIGAPPTGPPSDAAAVTEPAAEPTRHRLHPLADMATAE